MDTNTEYYRRQFYQEAREILEKVNNDILRAEADPDDPELLNAVFRGIHTIKGSAGVLELDDISVFTHHFEAILNALRDKRISLTPDLVDTILSGADHIIAMIDAYSSDRKPDIDHDLVKRFITYCEQAAPVGVRKEEKAADESLPSSVSDILLAEIPAEFQNSFQEAKEQGLNMFRVKVLYTSELFSNGYDPLVFLRNLKEACSFYAVSYPEPKRSFGILPAVPELKEFNPHELYLYPVVYVTTTLSAGEIIDLTFDAELIRVERICEEIAKPGLKGLELPDAESLREFIEGAVELLDSIETAVIDYEKTGASEALNQIFRAVHNIKGDADFIALHEIALFTHALESVLERLRSSSLQQTPEITDIILQSVDFLRQSITRLEQNNEILELPPVYQILKEYLIGEDSMLPHHAADAPSLSPELRAVLAEQIRQYKEILFGFTHPLPLDQKRRNVVERALKGLLKTANFGGLERLKRDVHKAIAASARQDDEIFADIVQKLFIVIEKPEPEPVATPLVHPEEESEEPDIQYLKKDASVGEIRTMRIDERKVEHFTNMVGELLIARNTYEHLLNKLSHAEGTERQIIRQFKDNLHLFSRLTNEMHYGIISLRMIPVGGIFQKFNRVVRDISRKKGKLIELVIGGEEIEIDKKVADMLSEPLVHLIRNACDHGIETPEKRKAAGKIEKGTIILRASQEGSNLSISIIDDGKGINRQKIYEKAKKKGIDADVSDKDALFDLIFMPGFSTSDEVSEISGRGVGLDVVKTTVQSLGGMIRGTSDESKGTEITLSIPMNMGIETVLLVEASKDAYAIPLNYIVETLKLPSENIKGTRNQQFFYYRGDVLPIKPLEKLIKADSQVASRKSQVANIELSVVVARTVRGRFGLIVDQFHKNMEIAVKPIPSIMGGIGIASGVTIMGDGRILLVLNPDKLF